MLQPSHLWLLRRDVSSLVDLHWDLVCLAEEPLIPSICWHYTRATWNQLIPDNHACWVVLLPHWSILLAWLGLLVGWWGLLQWHHIVQRLHAWLGLYSWRYIVGSRTLVSRISTLHWRKAVRMRPGCVCSVTTIPIHHIRFKFQAFVQIYRVALSTQRHGFNKAGSCFRVWSTSRPSPSDEKIGVRGATRTPTDEEIRVGDGWKIIFQLFAGNWRKTPDTAMRWYVGSWARPGEAICCQDEASPVLVEVWQIRQWVGAGTRGCSYGWIAWLAFLFTVSWWTRRCGTQRWEIAAEFLRRSGRIFLPTATPFSLRFASSIYRPWSSPWGLSWLGVWVQHPVWTLAALIVLYPHEAAMQGQVVTDGVLGNEGRANSVYKHFIAKQNPKSVAKSIHTIFSICERLPGIDIDIS